MCPAKSVRVDYLNTMALKFGLICRHRPMPEQLARMPNCTSLNVLGHQTHLILQVRTSVNVGMAKLVNLGAGIDLTRGDLECAGNNANM